MMPLFLTGFILLGGLFIFLSVPLIQRKVAPNSLYGFRVRRTLENPDIWYPANEYAAWRLLWMGVATIIVAVAAYFIPHIQLSVYATIVLAANVIGLAITLVQSFAYLAKLAREQDKKPSEPKDAA